MESGKVKWFDRKKGFGFIEKDDGTDLFVSYRDINDEGYKYLRFGQEVTFEEKTDKKGPIAKDIAVVKGGEGKGKVKWFDGRRGFGFIKQEKGEDLFAHYSAITGLGFRYLKEGQRVSFDQEDDAKGLIAKNVKITRNRK